VKKGIDCKANTCRERLAPPARFESRSFRMKRLKGGRMLVVGCPRGHYHPKRRGKKCDVGLLAQSLVRPLKNPKCRVCRIRPRKA
jgi:hypothetical protein